MFTSRPYAGQHDLERLSTFLTQARSDIHRAHYLHVGELVWQLFHMQAAFALSEIVHLWEDADGTLIGFVLLYPAFGFFDLEVQAQQAGQRLPSPTGMGCQSGPFMPNTKATRRRKPYTPMVSTFATVLCQPPRLRSGSAT